MSFRPEEVSAILAQELERYEAKLETKSVGTVLSVGDGISRVWGLEDAMAGELIKFPGDVMGMVLNLEEDNVGIVLFGSDKDIKEGDRVERTGRIASVPVGKAMIGRVVNAIGFVQEAPELHMAALQDGCQKVSVASQRECPVLPR